MSVTTAGEDIALKPDDAPKLDTVKSVRDYGAFYWTTCGPRGTTIHHEGTACPTP